MDYFGQAIDGGKALSADLWHPLRPPKVHSIESLNTLAPALESSWKEIIKSSSEVNDDEFFRPQIIEVVALFRHAAEHRERIVSVLERPADIERASRVEMPRFV